MLLEAGLPHVNNSPLSVKAQVCDVPQEAHKILYSSRARILKN